MSKLGILDFRTPKARTIILSPMPVLWPPRHLMCWLLDSPTAHRMLVPAKNVLLTDKPSDWFCTLLTTSATSESEFVLALEKERGVIEFGRTKPSSQMKANSRSSSISKNSPKRPKTLAQALSALTPDELARALVLIAKTAKKGDIK